MNRRQRKKAYRKRLSSGRSVQLALRAIGAELRKPYDQLVVRDLRVVIAEARKYR